MARKIIKPVFSRPREIRVLSQEDSFASCLLAYCLAEGASLTADGAKGGGGVATLIAGLARPNLWQQYGCNSYQGVLAKYSLALEKARKSVLRELPIRRFLFGNWNQKFRLDRYRDVDCYRGVDHHSGSKIKPFTDVSLRKLEQNSGWTDRDVDRCRGVDR